jgi:hypothetical protein
MDRSRSSSVWRNASRSSSEASRGTATGFPILATHFVNGNGI